MFSFDNFLAQKELNIDFSSKNDSVFFGFKSANSVHPDSVKTLLIDCDEFDSIDDRVTKFTNLKNLYIFKCNYVSAYMEGYLNQVQKNLYLRKTHEMDSINASPWVPIKGYTSQRMYAMWDSLLFSNKLKRISEDLYRLKNLQYIQININISRKAKRFLKRFQKKTGIYVMIGEDFL